VKGEIKRRRRVARAEALRRKRNAVRHLASPLFSESPAWLIAPERGRSSRIEGRARVRKTRPPSSVVIGPRPVPFDGSGVQFCWAAICFNLWTELITNTIEQRALGAFRSRVERSAQRAARADATTQQPAEPLAGGGVG